MTTGNPPQGIDGLGFWTPGTPTSGFSQRNTIMGSTDNGLLDAKYSPDGSHIVMYAWSSIYNNNQHTLFIDGVSGPIPGLSTYGMAWAPGPPMAAPSQLVLQPAPLWLYNGIRSPVSPSLTDVNGNVIARTATWSSTDVCPTCGFRCDNTPDQIACSGTQINGLSIDITNSVLGSGFNSQGNLCEANAGLRTCVPYYSTAGSAFVSVAAPRSVAYTSGVGGPGKFTIRRVGTPLTNGAIIVNFAITGTAQRDTDYTLDVTGTSVILAPGQTSAAELFSQLHK